MNIFRLLFILLHIFAVKYFWYLIVYVSNTTWRSKLKPTHTHSSLSSQLVQTWPTVQCQYDKSVYGWKSVNLLSCDQLIRALTRMLHDDDGAPIYYWSQPCGCTSLCWSSQAQARRDRSKRFKLSYQKLCNKINISASISILLWLYTCIFKLFFDWLKLNYFELMEGFAY